MYDDILYACLLCVFVCVRCPPPNVFDNNATANNDYYYYHLLHSHPAKRSLKGVYYIGITLRSIGRAVRCKTLRCELLPHFLTNGYETCHTHAWILVRRFARRIFQMCAKSVAIVTVHVLKKKEEKSCGANSCLMQFFLPMVMKLCTRMGVGG